MLTTINIEDENANEYKKRNVFYPYFVYLLTFR